MDDRYDAALEAVNALQGSAFSIAGVFAVQVESRPPLTPTAPGGPVVVVWTSDRAAAQAAQAAGTLPDRLATRRGDVPIEIAEGEMVDYAAHTGMERPMHPGASLGSQAPGGTGTFGAVVQRGGSPVALTAGHVAGAGQVKVYQPGPDDRPADAGTYAGAVISNPYHNGGIDAAIVGIDPQDLAPGPHDSPVPSERNPAVGILSGAIADLHGKPIAILYLDIGNALTLVGASLPSNWIKVAKEQQRVYASGRSSGRIESKVRSLGPVKQKNGFVAAGFVAEMITGGGHGDSGAVAVIRADYGTSWLSLPTGETVVESHDDDDDDEWLPGQSKDLDALMAGQDVHEIETELGLVSGAMASISQAVRNRVTRLMGNLSVNATAVTAPHPCRPPQPGAAAEPATSCIVRISRAEGGPQILMPNDPPPPVIEPVQSDRTCCTFGRLPVVSVSGDDSELATFTIEIGPVMLKVTIEAKQRVTDAAFTRTGRCWKGVCDKEQITGYVKLHRVVKVDFEAVAGAVTLPYVGKIEAGKGAISSRSESMPDKFFDFACSRA